MTKTQNLTTHALVLSALLASLSFAPAQELKPILLPKPQTEIGRPLMQVLKDRKTTRTFSDKQLSPQTLSNLLWAGFGINRPENAHRTAPSAMNSQEVDLYVAMADGLYLYDAKAHALKLVLAEDLRGATGNQPFVAEAPVDLVYVSDLAKTGNASAEDRLLYGGAHTGFISENVYLYCASEGLATVVRGLVDRAALAKRMQLRPDQRITLAQTVGYPKKK